MIRFFLLFLGKEIGFRVMNLSFYTKTFFVCSTNTFFLVNAINNCFYFCYSLWLSFVFWKEILTPKLSFSYFYLSIATAMNRYVVVRYIFVRNLALQFSAEQAGQLYYPSLPIFFSYLIFSFTVRWNLAPQQELYIFLEVQWIVTGYQIRCITFGDCAIFIRCRVGSLQLTWHPCVFIDVFLVWYGYNCHSSVLCSIFFFRQLRWK